MYASPPPVSPPTSSLTRARRSWMWISRAGSARASPNVRRVPSGRTTTRSPDPDPTRRPSPRSARRGGTGCESASRGSRPTVMDLVHRVASLCRWNRAPRSHSRSACQWIRPIVRCVTNGCRTSIRSDHPVGQGPPREVKARVQQQPVARVLVDRDPQARCLVADPDRVAAGHLDEGRDVERLVHRIDQRRSPSDRHPGGVYRWRSPCVLWTSTITDGGRRRRPGTGRSWPGLKT